jgi:hypothetical protein
MDPQMKKNLYVLIAVWAVALAAGAACTRGGADSPTGSNAAPEGEPSSVAVVQGGFADGSS